jgi:hypothetical protein
MRDGSPSHGPSISELVPGESKETNLTKGWACLVATHLNKNVISAKAEIQWRVLRGLGVLNI